MKNRLCIFGEVLFDHFPDGQRVLGGAPFNVAWNLTAFDLQPHLISRVGPDTAGSAIQQAMLDWGMDTSGLQFDRQQPTGEVQITLVDSEPHYDIVAPSAWDRIVPPHSPPQCDLFYHGTLALRDPVSRHALVRFIGNSDCQVFVDVNLRDPWWDRNDVLDWMARADWVKLNHDELQQLLPGDASEEQRAERCLREFGLQGLVVTRGARGAWLLASDGTRLHSQPAPTTEVVDTVGAGDAFASVLLFGLAREWPLEATLERAQSFASAVVGRRGATVQDQAFYRGFVDQWQTDRLD